MQGLSFRSLRTHHSPDHPTHTHSVLHRFPASGWARFSTRLQHGLGVLRGLVVYASQILRSEPAHAHKSLLVTVLVRPIVR